MGLGGFSSQTSLDIQADIINSFTVSIAFNNIGYANYQIMTFSTLANCATPPYIYLCLYDSMCYDDCSANGFYQYNKNCQICNSPCETCVNGTTYLCASCLSSFYLI